MTKGRLGTHVAAQENVRVSFADDREAESFFGPAGDNRSARTRRNCARFFNVVGAESGERGLIAPATRKS
jgi:hypothetical protein